MVVGRAPNLGVAALPPNHFKAEMFGKGGPERPGAGGENDTYYLREEFCGGQTSERERDFVSVGCPIGCNVEDSDKSSRPLRSWRQGKTTSLGSSKGGKNREKKTETEEKSPER